MVDYIVYDIKKSIWKWTILGLFPLVYLIALIMTFDMPMSVATTNVLNGLMPLLLMVVFADQFSADYVNKTYKTLFTGVYSREALLLGKLAACLVMALLLGFIHWLLPLPVQWAEGRSFIVSDLLKGLAQTEMVYCSAGLCLSSFCCMMGVLTKQFTLTFVACFILFYDLIAQAVGMIASSAHMNGFNIIAALMPFQIVPLVLTTQQITGLQALILIVSGMGFSMVGILKVSQQECH